MGFTVYSIKHEGVKTLPNIKSSEKRVRVAKTKTMQNQIIKTQLKTYLKKFDQLADQGSIDEAKSIYPVVSKKLDQAVAKGVLHKNTSSRRKSKLKRN